jgi:hypothetical protein
MRSNEIKMEYPEKFFPMNYKNFNDRKIELVIFQYDGIIVKLGQMEWMVVMCMDGRQ